MKKRNRKKRRTQVKVTPLGYFVLGVLSVLALLGVYLAVMTLFTGSPTAVAVKEVTPVPATEPPVEVLIGTLKDLPDLPAGTSETPGPVETPEPTPTPSPGMHNDVRMPTQEQIDAAVEGQLLHSGVAMRRGPDTGYGIVDKYPAGTMVDIYDSVGDYFFVRTHSDGSYGYIARKFVSSLWKLDDIDPTPVPQTLGLIDGVVGGNKVALRSVPSSKGNEPIGQCNKDAKVWIYFETNGFYFIEVVGSGEKGYISMDYVASMSEVPKGTPIPNWP